MNPAENPTLRLNKALQLILMQKLEPELAKDLRKTRLPNNFYPVNLLIGLAAKLAALI